MKIKIALLYILFINKLKELNISSLLSYIL